MLFVRKDTQNFWYGAFFLSEVLSNMSWIELFEVNAFMNAFIECSNWMHSSQWIHTCLANAPFEACEGCWGLQLFGSNLFTDKNALRNQFAKFCHIQAKITPLCIRIAQDTIELCMCIRSCYERFWWLYVSFLLKILSAQKWGASLHTNTSKLIKDLSQLPFTVSI